MTARPQPLSAQAVEVLKAQLRSHGIGILAMEEEMFRWHRQLGHADSIGAILDPTWYRDNMEQIDRWRELLGEFLRLAKAVRKVIERDKDILARTKAPGRA